MKINLVTILGAMSIYLAVSASLVRASEAMSTSGETTASASASSVSGDTQKIKALSLTDDSQKKNLAQISGIQSKSINLGKGLSTTLQMTSVYEGGIMAPFNTYLTIFDPTPQDGGDFGTYQTFEIEYFDQIPKIKSVKVITPTDKKALIKNQIIEVTLVGKVYDGMSDKKTSATYVFKVPVDTTNGTVGVEASLVTK